MLVFPEFLFSLVIKYCLASKQTKKRTVDYKPFRFLLFNPPFAADVSFLPQLSKLLFSWFHFFLGLFLYPDQVTSANTLVLTDEKEYQ